MAELVNTDIRPTLGNPTPEEYGNSLQSKQFATVVDLLGYGDIHSDLDDAGIITDGDLPGDNNLLQIGMNNVFRKNVFLDGTRLRNDNGEENFADVKVEYRSGKSKQNPSQLIDEIQKVETVGVEVPHGTPITRSIGVDNTNVDKLRVTLQIPILQKVDTDSNEITGTSIGVSIKIKENDGNEVDFVPKDVIVGRVTSPYLKDYEIKFTRDMNFPISITVERLFEEKTEYQRRVNWLSFTEITTDKRAYEGFAYVAVRFNAQQFQSFPKRMYRCKGTKILVPNGTTIDTDNGRVIYPDDYVFDGTFKAVEGNDLVFPLSNRTVDGNLKKEWCSDPAWILYDILTTDKGFGGENGIIDPDTLDVYSFFAASK